MVPAAPLTAKTFRNPGAEYRGAPFWSWNARLQREQLERQVGVFRQMGMGGFHIHTRTGLATPYLGTEFMDRVRDAVRWAKRDGLKVWLYDEDRWPSGFAGGLVTREPRFRARHLLFTPRPYDGTRQAPPLISNARAARFENGTLLACYALRFEGGRLARIDRLADGQPVPAGSQAWYAYLETAEPSPWWNNQTYVDTLNPEATARFIEVTHERYREAVGEEFGRAIPAIFTDEPQFVHKAVPRRADAQDDLFLPWTDDFAATFARAHGHDLLDRLPEVFWERADGAPSVVRYRYHDHLAERFAAGYADVLGRWCTRHGLMLTGHMMEEPTLHSQTSALGEAMRSYRSFHLPGIDMLCDRMEYTTAKQAASAARQYGRPGVLSELYGVTNWDFDFRGHKAQGDWQAALGVTLRVHHLAWVSMAGEAKRDYPASIFEQSPWWPEYPLVEDHFARLNTALTRGAAVARVGVIHPIESYWLCFGPNDQTDAARGAREAAFGDLTRWLLHGLIDFDFVAESLLPELCPGPAGAPLAVGAARYDVIVVPHLNTVRASTLARLEQFADAGGTLLFLGPAPQLVDACPSPRAAALAARAARADFTREALLDRLAPWRDVAVELDDGRAADSLLYHLRAEGDDRFVFFCSTDRVQAQPSTQIKLRGEWRVTQLDTLHGELSDWGARYADGWTWLTWTFEPHGHLLLHLTPGRRETPAGQVGEGPPLEVGRLHGPVPVTLSEPNVLLLDRPEGQLDGEAWSVPQDVLKLDTALRQRLGWPLRMDALAQPWSAPTAPACHHTLRLRFCFTVDARVECPSLALEDAETVDIELDGQRLARRITGWWVDEALHTVPLPTLDVGEHVLVVTLPYGPSSNPEACYLLGDFGVEVRGVEARVVAPVRTLHFGDWTHQGLPFYGGNVTYHCPLPAGGVGRALHVPHFRSPLLRARSGGWSEALAFAPYRVRLPDDARTLDLTAYGSRVNTFGALHNADATVRWFGPDAWRSEGEAWSDEYLLKPQGVLTAPRILDRL